MPPDTRLADDPVMLEEDLEEAPRSVFARAVQLVVALFLVAALLVYFIVPFRNIAMSIRLPWQQPARTRPIPVAPDKEKNPVQVVCMPKRSGRVLPARL